MIKPNKIIRKRFKEFIETYPEEQRLKVKPGNVLSLMQWSYNKGKIDTYNEFVKDLGKLEK